MQRAEYTITKNKDISELKHSALNFDLYTHFTSPIRRYPDLVVHRQLKYILKKMNILEMNNESCKPECKEIDIKVNKDKMINLNTIDTNQVRNNTISLNIENTENDHLIINEEIENLNKKSDIKNEFNNNKNKDHINKNISVEAINEILQEEKIILLNCSRSFLDSIIKSVLLKLKKDEEYNNNDNSTSNGDLLVSVNDLINIAQPDKVIKDDLENVVNNEEISESDEYEKENIINYEKFIDHFNEKYYNGKMISTKCQKLFQCIFLKNIPSETYQAFIVDICNKIPMKNKRISQQNNNFDTQTLIISIYLPKLNLELVNIILFISNE